MMRRDLFAAGVTGRGLYHFDLQGAGWFGENHTTAQRDTTSAIWHAIGEAQDALRKVTPSIGPLGLPQTAVFVDERAKLEDLEYAGARLRHRDRVLRLCAKTLGVVLGIVTAWAGGPLTLSLVVPTLAKAAPELLGIGRQLAQEAREDPAFARLRG